MNISEEIVYAILKELRGRCGIGDELDNIDEEIMEELMEKLEKIVEDKLKNAIL